MVVWICGIALVGIVMWLIMQSQGQPVKCNCCSEQLKEYLFAKKLVGYFCSKCNKEYISCKYTGNERGALHVMYKRVLHVTRDPEWIKRPKIVYNNLNNINQNTLKLGDHIKWTSRHAFHGIVVSPIDPEGNFYVIKFSSSAEKKVDIESFNVHPNHGLRLQLATYRMTSDMKTDDACIIVARAHSLLRCIIHCSSIPEDRNESENKALFCKFGVRIKLTNGGGILFFGRSFSG